MRDKAKKAAYDKEYNRKNVKRLFIPFNMTKPEDVELLAYIRQHPNTTEYIKRLVALDMADNTAKN